jgi:hypothetical protein
MRGAKAGGASADDGDIDFGGEGHEVVGLGVMPGLKREARLRADVPDIYVLLCSIQDVDGRDKPGHDGILV